MQRKRSPLLHSYYLLRHIRLPPLGRAGNFPSVAFYVYPFALEEYYLLLQIMARILLFMAVCVSFGCAASFFKN